MAKSLYLGDLSSICTKHDLYREFSRFGTITHVHIQYNARTRSSLGFGFLTYLKDDEGDRAIKALNGIMFLGRKLIVSIANREEFQHQERVYQYDLHIRFEAQLHGKSTNEIIIRDIFTRFGDVDDVSIRRQLLNNVSIVYFFIIMTCSILDLYMDMLI